MTGTRRRYYHPGRCAAFAPGPLLGLGGWLYLGGWLRLYGWSYLHGQLYLHGRPFVHEIGTGTGFGVLVGSATLLWPLIVIGLIMLPSCIQVLVVPHRVRAARRHRERERERERARQEAREPDGHRPGDHVPAWLKRVIAAADRHRCVYCGARRGLQYDHILPWDRGGLSSLFNLALLCCDCNRIKSDYWEYRNGYVGYRPWAGYRNKPLARRILAKERRRRLYPWRWLRAAWALG